MFYYKMAVHDACAFTGTKLTSYSFTHSLTYLLTHSGNDVALGTDLGAAMTGPVSEAYVGGGG